MAAGDAPGHWLSELQTGNAHFDARALPGGGADGKFTTELLDAFPHTKQSE
jgi:hypothetical protein